MHVFSAGRPVKAQGKPKQHIMHGLFTTDGGALFIPCRESLLETFKPVLFSYICLYKHSLPHSRYQDVSSVIKPPPVRYYPKPVCEETSDKLWEMRMRWLLKCVNVCRYCPAVGFVRTVVISCLTKWGHKYNSLNLFLISKRHEKFISSLGKQWGTSHTLNKYFMVTARALIWWLRRV